jgi:RNA polymerase sigma-70 factor (ECF subfamily)
MANGMNRITGTLDPRATFEDVVLPHLDAGYRLARWLVRNEHDAEDVVQEASLRAFRYFRTFAGGNGRAWFLRIVRNTCHGGRRPFQAVTDPFDEERHSTLQSGHDPEALMLRTDTAVFIERAISSLPDRFRELLVLRELEGLSYRELADVMEIPIGTVMSGLSRAREALRLVVSDELKPRSPDTASRTPDPGSRSVSSVNVEQEEIEEAVM